jgi:hypothetical protein
MGASEIKSPEFTDPKKKLDINRSTGLNTISGLINTTNTPKANTPSGLQRPLGNGVTTQNFNFNSIQKPLYKVDKLYPDVNGVKYDEYLNMGASPLERSKVSSSLSHTDPHAPTTSNLIAAHLNQPKASGRIPDERSLLEASKKDSSTFGVFSLPTHGQFEQAIPRFDSYMPISSKHQKELPYRFSQMESADVGPRDIKTNSPNHDQEETIGYDPSKDDWTGLSILKKYASKDKLQPVTKKVDSKAKFEQSKSAMNLAQAFFSNPLAQKKSTEDQYYNSIDDELKKDCSPKIDSEFKGKFSRLNTFGRYQSKDQQIWDSPADKAKITLQAYMSKQYQESISEMSHKEPEENKYNQKKPGEQPKKLIPYPTNLTPVNGSTRDSYVNNLLAKIGKSHVTQASRMSPYIDKNLPNRKMEAHTRQETFTKSSHRSRFTQRELSESQRIINTLDQPLVQGHSRPGFHHEKHSHQIGQLVPQSERRGGPSSRQIKVNIDSLVQRTLSDLRH